MPARQRVRDLRSIAGACAWLWVCCVLGTAGCANCRLPRIDPTGERLFVWGDAPPPVPVPAVLPANPAATAQWGISVSPSQVIAPVGSEVIMIASVCGAEGYMLTRQKVEWMLAPEGVGQLMSPGERHPLELLNWMHGLPKKVDNGYAINTTLTGNVTLDRGTPALNDDVLVQAGQSWVSVTSPSEGTSRVTVFAPEVYGWDRRHQSATIYWVDAQWRFPPPAITPVGGRHTLVTTLARQTDNSPLPGWVVRYEIAGGPEAGFAPDGSTSVEVVTGASGEATVEIVQKQAVAGTNQVNIQITRPGNLAGQTRPLTLGAGSVLQTWTAGAAPGAWIAPPASAPPTPIVPPGTTVPPSDSTPRTTPAAAQLDVTIAGPNTATVGSDVQFEIDVVNRGSAPATGLLVSNRFDAGLQHAISTSPIERDLADLPPGASARLNVAFRVAGAGEPCQEVTVTGAGGLRATARRCITAIEPAPEQPATPGQPVQPPASEPSAQPAQPPAEQPPAEHPPATRETPAAPTGAPLTLKITAPERRQVGETALFSIEVSNQSGRSLENVEISANFETTLQPLRATEDSKWLEGGALGWKIAAIEPGQTLRRSIEFTCLRDTPKSCTRATVSASGVEARAEEACLEIAGTTPESTTPADSAAPVSVSVAETADPIKIGTDTNYQILVTNKGTQSVFDVAVTVTFGDELRFEGVTAPLPERPKILPGEVRFPPVREIRAGENPLSYELKFKGLAPGTGRLHVEVTSRGQAAPIVANETTEVLAE